MVPGPRICVGCHFWCAYIMHKHARLTTNFCDCPTRSSPHAKVALPICRAMLAAQTARLPILRRWFFAWKATCRCFFHAHNPRSRPRAASSHCCLLLVRRTQYWIRMQPTATRAMPCGPQGIHKYLLVAFRELANYVQPEETILAPGAPCTAQCPGSHGFCCHFQVSVRFDFPHSRGKLHSPADPAA